MPKRKLLQIGDITPRMASRLEADFDIIESVSYTHLTLPTILRV